MTDKDTNMWYLYILGCADGTFYTGISPDLTKRLKTHNQGKASRYTRMRLPVEMIYNEPHPDKSSARKREIQVKKWPRPQKLALIQKSK